jgi:hypothetical protein
VSEKPKESKILFNFGLSPAEIADIAEIPCGMIHNIRQIRAIRVRNSFNRLGDRMFWIRFAEKFHKIYPKSYKISAISAISAGLKILCGRNVIL